MKSYDPRKNNRRSIRLKEYDYSRPGAYFITICTHNREPLFGSIINSEMKSNLYGVFVSKRWNNLPRYYHHLETNAFVIMPNHIHGILVIKSDSRKMIKGQPISEIVRDFKTFSSRRINEVRGMSGTPIWQRNYWEHIIRNDDSFKRIYDYILTNPLRWHLDKENPYREGEDDFDRWIDSL